MKKSSLFLAVLLARSIVVNAQGGFQRRTVEEDVAIAHHKIDSAFKLEAGKLTIVDAELADYYKARDAKFQEWFGGGSQPDGDTRMAEMKKLSDARDEKLKLVFTDEQYKKWIDEIEPSLPPQRP
ncbi:MAG: hypothetical protein JJE22_07475 [Bacteroidia bacterium]|nr:hypothetical protein [Bacteroidia bacterium]